MALLFARYYYLTHTQEELDRVTTLAELKVVEKKWEEDKKYMWLIALVCTLFHFASVWLGGMWIVYALAPYIVINCIVPAIYLGHAQKLLNEKRQALENTANAATTQVLEDGQAARFFEASGPPAHQTTAEVEMGDGGQGGLDAAVLQAGVVGASSKSAGSARANPELPAKSLTKKLRELQAAKDQGLLTEAEHRDAKAAALASI